MTYEEQLLHPDWIYLRKQVLERDNGVCQLCLSDDHLHVHHKTYIDGRLAWEYPMDLLITLCGECHAKFHNIERKPLKFKEDILQIAERCARSVSALWYLDGKIYEREKDNFIKKASGK